MKKTNRRKPEMGILYTFAFGILCFALARYWALNPNPNPQQSNLIIDFFFILCNLFILWFFILSITNNFFRDENIYQNKIKLSPSLQRRVIIFGAIYIISLFGSFLSLGLIEHRLSYIVKFRGAILWFILGLISSVKWVILKTAKPSRYEYYLTSNIWKLVAGIMSVFYAAHIYQIIHELFGVSILIW